MGIARSCASKRLMTPRWMNGRANRHTRNSPTAITKMLTQFPDNQPTSWSVWGEVGGRGNGGVVGAGVGVGAGAADGTLMRRSSPGQALSDQERPQDEQGDRLDGRVVLHEPRPGGLEACAPGRPRAA